MKNKIKLLILSASTLFGLVGVGTTVLNEVDNSYAISTKVDGLEGTRINKEAKYDANIEFGNGSGNEYLSNVRVQYAEGTTDGTGAIRLVAAVKGQVNSSSSVTLPGTYGFHVSYDKGDEVKNYMYDVEYVYHSISENIDGNTTYYTNDYSSYLSSEGRKTIADWAGDANSEYNLFIALKIDNIPAEQLDSIVTVQPYLVTGEETLTSANVRYANASDAQAVYSSYYLDTTSKGLLKLTSTDGVVYGRGDVVLSVGEKANLVNQYGEIVEEYTVTRNGSYYAKYTGSEYELWTGIGDTTFEAERALLDYGSKYIGTSTASGNALAGNIDHAGQGLQYYYFSYGAGEYDLDAYYVSGMTNTPTCNVLVNGENQAVLTMENTGDWGDASTAKVATAKIRLNVGWNKINILKGDSYAQFDKFVLKAGTTFNLRAFDGYNFDVAPSYRLEAELGTHVLKNVEAGKWYANAKAPGASASASLGYSIGGIDAVGQGIEWAFNAPKAGKYQVKVSAAQSNGAQGNSFYFYHSKVNYRDSVPNADEMAAVETIMNLENTGAGWGNFSEDTATIVLDLQQGYNFIYALKGYDSSYAELDYVELTYLGE